MAMDSPPHLAGDDRVHLVSPQDSPSSLRLSTLTMEVMQNMEEENPRRQQDLLSGLHDNVLHRILSFLPTREAIATSMLSRRWRHLWKTVPCLDLDYHGFHRRRCPIGERKFCHFVGRVIAARDPASGVRRFRLRWCGQLMTDIHLATWWVDSAIRPDRGGGGLLRELDLHLYTFTGFPLDAILRGLPCLEKLSLAAEKDYYVGFAHPPQFPSLTTLRLRKIGSFEAARRCPLPSRDASPGALEMLIAGCPSLEDLTLESCSFLRLRFSAPRLVRLAVIDHRRGNGVDVEAPELRSIRYTAVWDQKPWCLRGAARLWCAMVDLALLESVDLQRLADALGEGMRTLRSLALRFAGAAMEPPPEEEHRRVCFDSLETLKLFVHVNEGIIPAVTFLLTNSPSLRTLQVEYSKHGSRTEEEEEFVKIIKDSSSYLDRVTLVRRRKRSRADIPTIAHLS
ncbi:hypothetical protein Taro_043908 [Colocasia esculenta]|uniref:F-box domain-containing protein n=1 Tax=Colocasia esculenta TaxID=4460 RepID=A0A843X4R2_COLES|nr:hypothetical protein [Colocasia esculenta]